MYNLFNLFALAVLLSGCGHIKDVRSEFRSKTLCKMSPEAQDIFINERKSVGVTYDLDIYCANIVN